MSLKLIALLATLAMLLVACGGDDDDTDDPDASETSGAGESDSQAEPVSGGELVVAPQVQPTQLDPHKQAHAGEEGFIFALYDRLTTLDKDMNVIPMLATEWSYADDGLTLSMTLRDDVTFHDGTEFNAEAVVANIERAKTLEESTVAAQLDSIESVEATSPTEVVFHLAEPQASLVATLAGAPGAMISPAAIESGADLGQSPGDAGSGPYMLESATFPEKFVLTPAPNYWDESVHQLDKLTLLIIRDQQTRLSALQTGEIDAGSLGSDPANVQQGQSLAEGGDFKFISTPSGVAVGLMIRSQRPGVDTVEARAAIAQSINQSTIVDGIMAGTCTATDQIFPEGWPGHIDNFEAPYSYDLDAAQAAAEDAGIAGDYEMVVNAGSQPFPRLAEAVQPMLAEIGVAAEITPLNSVEALTLFQDGGTDFWMYQLSQSLDPALSVSDYILGPRFGSESEAIQQAYEAAEAATDPEDRDQALQDLSQAVAEEAVLAPLCFINANWLAKDYVQGIEQMTRPYIDFGFDVRYLSRAEG